jgi:hypothetical protein
MSWCQQEEHSGIGYDESRWRSFSSDRSKPTRSVEENGFDGQHLHAVQVGLGTFATVMQNFVGAYDEWDPMIAWLLESTSECCPEHFRAVAVEPVAEATSHM